MLRFILFPLLLGLKVIFPGTCCCFKLTFIDSLMSLERRKTFETDLSKAGNYLLHGPCKNPFQTNSNSSLKRSLKDSPYVYFTPVHARKIIESAWGSQPLAFPKKNKKTPLFWKQKIAQFTSFYTPATINANIMVSKKSENLIKLNFRFWTPKVPVNIVKGVFRFPENLQPFMADLLTYQKPTRSDNLHTFTNVVLKYIGLFEFIKVDGKLIRLLFHVQSHPGGLFWGGIIILDGALSLNISWICCI